MRFINLISALAISALAGLPGGHAAAHCPHNGNPTHKHCDGGGDGGGGDDAALPDPVIVLEAYGSKDRSDRLAVADPGGRSAIILRSDARYATAPHWFPDGKSIVFASDWNGTPGIYRLRVADEEGKLIVGDPAVVPEFVVETAASLLIDPSLATIDDGSGDLLLAYVGYERFSDTAYTYDIMLARLTADGEVKLDGNDAPMIVNATDDDSIVYLKPALSPGSVQLAFVSNSDPGHDNLLVADVLFDAGGWPSLGPFTSLVEGVGSELEAVIATPYSSLIGPEFSNGATEITMTVSHEASDRDIWIVPVAAPQDAYPLMETGDIAELRPSWSPDDTQLVHMQLRGPSCVTRRRFDWVIVIRNVDGSDIDGCEAKTIVNFGAEPHWRRFE